MADIRINSLPTTASASSSDDFLALDGATNGTRKLNAYSPTFGGNLTVGSASSTTTFTNSANGFTVNSATGNALAIFNSSAADASVTNNAYLTIQTAGVARWYLGQSISAADGNFQIYGAVFGAPILTLNKTTGATTLAGNLTVSGTQIQMGGVNPFIQGTTGAGYIQFQNAGDVVVASNTGKLVLIANGSTRATVATTGNFLIGTPTDSGNGKLQLADHTTSAGGIGFGTDISLFRRDATALKLNSSFDISNGSTGASIVNAIQLNGGGSSGANNNLDAIQWGGGGLAWLRIYGIRDAGGGFGGTQYFQTMNGSGTLTTALTLDSSQNAAFAGSVGIGTTSPQYSLQVSAPNTASYYPLALSSGVIGTIGNTVGMRFGFTGNTYQKGAIIYESTSSNGVGKLHFALNAVENSSNVTLSDSKFVLTSSGDATFAGNALVKSFVTLAGPTSGTSFLHWKETSVADRGVLGFEAGSSTLKYRAGGYSMATGTEVFSISSTGAIAIGNTVQTAVGVASTHKVTISIGGSTYYLLATNV